MTTVKRKSTHGAVALTGTSGFLGSSLLRRLESDPRYPHVVAIDNRKPPFALEKTRFYRIDLTEVLADTKLVEIFRHEQVQTVIHAALPVTPVHNMSYTHELQSVGTMYLLNACAACGVHKTVLTSTTDIYGAHPTNPNFLSESAPLRGGYKSRFIADKVDAEMQFLGFAKKHPNAVVTILRPCTILGPNVHNFKTTFIQRPVVFTVMGYDPLFQFVHEDDVLGALELTIDKDFPGIFNIVGEGVVPLSKVLKLAGKVSCALPSPFLYPVSQILWYTNFSPAPASHLDFLKYLCVADGEKVRQVMKFKPRYTTKEALLSFIGAMRLRDVHLMEATT